MKSKENETDKERKSEDIESMTKKLKEVVLQRLRYLH